MLFKPLKCLKTSLNQHNTAFYLNQLNSGGFFTVAGADSVSPRPKGTALM